MTIKQLIDKIDVYTTDITMIPADDVTKKCITYKKGCYSACTFWSIRKCKVIGIETSPYNELCIAVILKGNDLPKQ